MSAEDTGRPPALALELGRRLKEAREALGLPQAAVASALKIPRPSVSEIESGRRKVSVLELDKLATLYRRPIEHFYGREPEAEDEVAAALFRTAHELSSDDRRQVLKFAEFLRAAGPAQTGRNDE